MNAVRLDDKELATVGAGAGVGHRQGTTQVVQLGGELVLKAVTPNALAAAAGGGGISPLDHKIFDHTVKDGVVIEPFPGKKNKVIL